MFVSADGSHYKTVSARSFSQIPVWRGNRLIDMVHVEKIREGIRTSIQFLNSNPYRIALITEEDGTTKQYIIDGQHRAYILKQYFEKEEAVDFDVLVAGRKFENEDEIIDYFKAINTTRAIQWKEDPVMKANTYLAAMMKEFNDNPKQPMIRAGKTTRPFLSADKLRDAILGRKVEGWTITPMEFAEHCRNQNVLLTDGLKVKPAPSDMELRALKYKFSLGLDTGMNWI
jgi:hypothetical protein